MEKFFTSSLDKETLPKELPSGNQSPTFEATVPSAMPNLWTLKGRLKAG
ncbi:MAG: hypothetical protein V7K48_24505 [Nostoc sp.]